MWEGDRAAKPVKVVWTKKNTDLSTFENLEVDKFLEKWNSSTLTTLNNMITVTDT